MGNPLHQQHRPARLAEHMQHLCQRGRFRVEEVVRQQHGEGRIAHRFAPAEHRVPEPARRFLRYRRHVRH